MTIIHIPIGARWMPYEIGPARTAHVLRKTRDGWCVRVGEVNIDAVLLPGGEGGGMIVLTLDGSRFYLKERDGDYAGGGLVMGLPSAFVARVTEHGLMLEICDVEAVP